jgi:hypothetical protein
MHFQYPLETLARKRSGGSQLAFAHEARRALFDSDEVLFEAHDHGLAIFAANEAALEAPTRILHELYGDFVQVRRPRVRYLPGQPPSEPIMEARIRTRNEHAAPVVRELRARDARIVEECVRSRMFIVRAEAPLAVLLGLPTLLEDITQGNVAHSLRLLRYVPMPLPEPPAA